MKYCVSEVWERSEGGRGERTWAAAPPERYPGKYARLVPGVPVDVPCMLFAPPYGLPNAPDPAPAPPAAPAPALAPPNAAPPAPYAVPWFPPPNCGPAKVLEAPMDAGALGELLYAPAAG